MASPNHSLEQALEERIEMEYERQQSGSTNSLKCDIRLARFACGRHLGRAAESRDVRQRVDGSSHRDMRRFIEQHAHPWTCRAAQVGPPCGVRRRW